MDGVGPSREVIAAICQGIREGWGVPRACMAVGVDELTIQRWMARGEVAHCNGRYEDPYAVLYVAFRRACNAARASGYRLGLREQGTSTSRPNGSSGHLRRPNRTDLRPSDDPTTRSSGNPAPRSSSELAPLARLVVVEAPIEIVYGSRPAWVYGPDPEPHRDEPARRPGFEEPVAAETPAPVVTEVGPSEPDEPATSGLDGAESSRSSPDVPTWAIFVALIINLVLLIATLAMVAATILIATAVFVVTGPIRLALALAYRWRAGLRALWGGGAEACPCPVAWASRGTSLRSSFVVRPDRRLGALAWTGRSLPQRE